MPFSGAAVAYCVAGGLIAYSGFKGASISATVKGSLTGNLGNVPSASPPPTVTTGGTIITPGPTGGGGGGGTTPPAEQEWISEFLQGIGAPLTQANMNSISGWISHEGPYGTQAENNPLNTTLQEPGSTSFDGLPPQNYPTAAEGLQATIDTIENGSYNDILMALKAGNGLCGQTWQGLATWSGQGYDQVC